jgi:hypothetical protein
MSKKTTLERSYFHINNGGLSFSIVERVDIRKDCTIFPEDWHKPMSSEEREARLASLPTEDRHNRSWTLKLETNHFGVSTQYSFPLVPVTVKWLIGGLQRVLARMEAPQEHPSDLSRGSSFLYEKADNVHVTAQDGQQVDFYWPVPRESCVGGSGNDQSLVAKD